MATNKIVGKWLEKHYALGLFVPFLVALAGTFLIGYVDVVTGPVYESEWLTGEVVLYILMIYSVINGLIINLLGSSLALNFSVRVRSSATLSGIAWFLPILCWTGVVVVFFWREPGQRGSVEYLFLLVNTLPYVAGLVFTFLRFRKQMKRSGAQVMGPNNNGLDGAASSANGGT